MSASVLVLNIDYSPLEVIDWKEAIAKILMGKVEMVEEYAGKFIRTSRESWAFPAVVRLTGKYVKRKAKLSRSNLLARDGYTCQYCGITPRKASGVPRLEVLTLDHVFPKSRAVNGWVTLPWSGDLARVTSWENLLTACQACNGEKGAQTPGEAGLHMRSLPRVPSSYDLARMSIFQYRIPKEWTFYLPEGSPWAGYWDDELED